MAIKILGISAAIIVIDGIAFILIGIFGIVATQLALVDLDRSVRDLSEIPFVGWIVGAIVNVSVAERREELEKFRLLGFGTILGGIFLIAIGILLDRAKASGSGEASQTSSATSSANTGPVPTFACQACGFYNAEALRFCGNCGRALH